MTRVRKNWTAEEDALLRKLVNSDNGDSEGEEEDDEEDEGRDGELDEYIDEDEQGNGTPNHSPLDTHDLVANKVASRSNPYTTETPSMWTGYTGALHESIDQWMNVAMNDQTMYMNIDPQLYSGEGLPYANRDASELDMSLASSTQGTKSLQRLNIVEFSTVDADAMTIDFDSLQDCFPGTQSFDIENPVMPLTCITPPSTSLPGEDIPGLSTKERDAITSQGLLYHISIDMACKPDQLGDVMNWVTNIGLACDVKIKSQA
ncbi:DNA-binding protein [Talaromyces pinophilus]|uniref:DNA-binding protein n=1 Tax=Talaromyces pinophilus TaxID=128442 RepID=A0A6V8HH52_TALPI|nr:DNA-binding protein [Talaromyces pinophilus]